MSSRDSLLPISDRSGPISRPSPLTLWHLMQVPSVANTIFPRWAWPRRLASWLIGGSGSRCEVAGGSNTNLASSRIRWFFEPRSPSVTANRMSSPSSPRRTNSKRNRWPGTLLHNPVAAAIRTCRRACASPTICCNNAIASGVPRCPKANAAVAARSTFPSPNACRTTSIRPARNRSRPASTFNVVSGEATNIWWRMSVWSNTCSRSTTRRYSSVPARCRR